MKGFISDSLNFFIPQGYFMNYPCGIVYLVI